jgi:pyrimidine operon attenuation protein/uracil phosphoribosyltransferase
MATQSIKLLDAKAIQRALDRIAKAIALRNGPNTPIVLVGIHRRGVPLAQRLGLSLSKRWKRTIPVGSLDIGMHRDDLAKRLPPNMYPTAIPDDITDKTVILVDDVLFKGRTARAAMDALNDFGRPRCIQLAVLIDRGHRELPIRADFVGRQVTTGLADRVNVRIREEDQEEGVTLESNGLAS